MAEKHTILGDKVHVYQCENSSVYGYDMYYLNVMAGPRRNWRFQNHPDHDWIYQRDK